MVDAAEGVLGLEWIDGKMVRALLPGGAEEGQADHSIPDLRDATLAEFGVTQGRCLVDSPQFFSDLLAPDTLMSMIGVEIAKMHLTDIIHGDLTTSNMMLRRDTNDLVCCIFPCELTSSSTFIPGAH